MSLFKSVIIGTTSLSFLIVSACSGNSEPAASNIPDNKPAASSSGVPSEPITLKFYNTSGTFPNVEFNTLIRDPIKKKYPNITIERLEPPSGTTPAEYLSSGVVPDIIYSSSTSHQVVKRTGAYQDLRELIKKYQFDESRIKPFLYNYVKEISDKGEILAIPFNSNQHILYYNKDIFDKFGVPYPSDKQMTWDEVIDLGRQLTRTENGVNYIGIDAEGPYGLAKSYGLELVDRKTNRSLLNLPEWTKVFETAKKNYEIPGYIGSKGEYVYGRDQFMKDRTLAMRPTWLANMVGPMEELRQQGLELNWDIAPIPTFPDKLGKGRESQVHTLSVNSKSANKDAAFLVIAHILSDEGQRVLSRNGRVPAIISPELEKEFGADIGVLKNKNVKNVFAVEPLQEHIFHPYETEVRKYVDEAAKAIATERVDINTALRTASEKINKDVETFIKNE